MPESPPVDRPSTRLAALLPGLLVLVTLIAAWSFFAPDDLFIHLRFARNLAERGEWSFNPGETVAGATSPPWVLSLTALQLIGVGGVLGAKLLAR